MSGADLVSIRSSKDYESRKKIQSKGTDKKDGESQGPNEFSFLENFVRRLICQLTDMQERKRAANWLKFLKKNEFNPLAINYVLILMLVLNRKRLVKPFDEQPPDDFKPMGKLKLRGMCRFIMEQYKNLPQEQNKHTMRVSYSDDFKQYGCVQNLGSQGVHCYCAFSSVPVTVWDNCHHLRQYNIQQCANYLSYKMSLIEDKMHESINKRSSNEDGIPESFLQYIANLKKFRMPFIGRLHVKGVNDPKQPKMYPKSC